MLFLLLKKGFKEKCSISVCFETEVQVHQFSEKLWAAYDTLPHGLIADGYSQLQPIILDTKLHNKDIAIIVDGAKFEEGKWEKVFFIGINAREFDGKYFEYKARTWKELTKEQFFI